MALRFYYFNSTHWDREWYQPMENYRRHLVDTADGILKALENGKIEKYTFDGQTIVLEDILEIRPDWRERVQAQVAAGKLNVGPWYVMPDEFLISGESMIHNLLIGKEIAESFGHAPWHCGYICDIFGHAAQTPQIFAGFDLAPAVLWRGIHHDAPPFFYWESPDGTRCPVVRLPGECGYGAYTLKVTGLWDLPLDEETFKKRFKAYAENRRAICGDHIVITDALDHMHVNSHLQDQFRWIKELYPDCELIHTDYSETMQEFDGTNAVMTGELIDTCHRDYDSPPQIPHTLSSRYDVKSGNDRCANTMEYTTDPILAAMALNNKDNMLYFGKYAWKQLIKNHPHDSICGCSIDAVHRQMLPRFEAIDQVLSEIIDEHKHDDRYVNTGKTITEVTFDGVEESQRLNDIDKNGNYTIRIFNPMPWDRKETVELDIVLPTAAYPQMWAEPFGYEAFPCFHLFNENGEEVPYQRGKQKTNSQFNIHRADWRVRNILPVTVELELKASAWTTVQLKPSVARPRCFLSQLTGPRSAENKFIKLAIDTDGSIRITDKRTGKSFSRLNSFIIDREIGDGWNHVRPSGAAEYTQNLTARSVSVRTDGPNRTTFEIISDIQVPAELDYTYNGICESEVFKTLTIKSLVTLDASSPNVQIKTVINNNIKDFRLRLVVPTGISGKYFACQTYTFIEREAWRALGRTTEDYLEAEPVEKNFNGIVGKRDAEGGLAFVARYGLHEVGASAYNAGELYITLIRAFRKTVGTDGEVDGQLQKELTYEYSFNPLTAFDDNAALWKYMCTYRSQLPYYLVPAVDGVKGDSLLKIDGDLSFCTFKPLHSNETGKAILRLVNYKDTTASSVIKLARPARVVEVKLDETTEVAVIAEKASEFSVQAAPDKIKTYRIEFC